MADTPLFSGGTSEFKAYYCEGDPQYSRPPFTQPHIPGTPVADAHYDACAPRAGCVASQPLSPSRFVQQFNNIKHFKPDVDDILQLVLVPCNHFLIGVRFDVSDEDPNMDGALVRIAGQRVAVDPTNPDSYLISELPDFDDAAAAQGLGDIPLDVPGSYVLWLAKLSNGGATGDAPAGGGPITSGGATGYFQPLYVPPETINYAGKTKHYMTGGLYLGLKVVHQPTDVAYTIGDMTNTCYMGAHIFGFEFKHGV